MSKLLSLLVFALFAFDVSFVAARPHTLKDSANHNSNPLAPEVKFLNTNTKRFAAGLPPLPPVRRKPTGVQAARRAVTSQCAKSGVIEVLNADTNVVEGYVSALKDDHYGLSDLGGAATFASSVYTSGVTDDINLLDVSSGTHYLAGLIEKNQPLGDGTSDAMTAILGQSLATNPGDSPQADKDPSITGRDAETAIWSYDRTNDDLTATWVNYNGQIPASTTAYISYISSRDEFYLTNSRTAPSDGSPVLFQYISLNDQCSG